MSLEPAPSSDLNRLLRIMLDGDLTAANGVLDELYALPDRLHDWHWLRERIGALAVANYGEFFGDQTTENKRKKFRAEVGEDHAIKEKSWEAFVEAVAARFWFDLYDMEGTLASLSESWKRTRPFGFVPG
jgi:hypothetical protein